MGAGGSFGRFIRDNHLNVTDVSEKSGVNKQTIYSFINRDSNRIDINDFIKMCEAVGVRPEYFADDFKKDEDLFNLTQEEQKLVLAYRNMQIEDKSMIDRIVAYYKLLQKPHNTDNSTNGR